MLKKPGAFSQKYMSNTLSNRQSLPNRHQKHPNKQNTNLNGTFDEGDSNLQAHRHHKITPPKLHVHDRINASTIQKIKQQSQKKQKQLNNQICRLRKEINKLRCIKQNKGLLVGNQQTICKYEQYMKEVHQEKDELVEEIQQLKDKNLQYQDYLQYSVLWLIQIFSLGTQKTGVKALQKFINKDKFAQLFQRLQPIVQQLKIQEQLRKLCSKNSQQNSVQDYLLLENNDFSIQSSIHSGNMQPQLPTLLDTFDFRKGYEEGESNQERGLARRLFLKDQEDQNETFNENGRKTQKNYIKIQSQKDKSSKQNNSKKVKNQKQLKPDDIIIMSSNYKPQQDDYLSLDKGMEVRLLRKVGQHLWIVQVGDNIGYVEACCLQQ